MVLSVNQVANCTGVHNILTAERCEEGLDCNRFTDESFHHDSLRTLGLSSAVR